MNNIEDVAVTLRASGMRVSADPNSMLTVAAHLPADLCSNDPGATFHVDLSGDEFGARLIQVGQEPIRYDSLKVATDATLALFDQFRERCSPEVYRDHFARFHATSPAPRIEQILANAAWTDPPSNELSSLGLQFGPIAMFRVAFNSQQVGILVRVAVERSKDTLLSARSYQLARHSSAFPSFGRSHTREGIPLAIPSGPRVCFKVASVLHAGLCGFAENIRWAVHHDPAFGNARSEPVPLE